MNWTEKLLLWYSENKRSFLWRTTKEPYHIWISEVILQQTRTSQGLPYYKNFLKAFPLLSDLATADENEVLKLWQGLAIILEQETFMQPLNTFTLNAQVFSLHLLMT